MKPIYHALKSAKKYGGIPEDYVHIHTFMDSSKAHMADNRHRCLLHSTFGIFIAEQVYGTYITNSDGRIVPVRNIAEDHVEEDMGGTIPSVQDWLKHMPIEEWMAGKAKSDKTRKVMRFDND